MGRMMKEQYLIKCECGWRGADKDLRRSYILVPPDEVAPEYKCPNCGVSEYNCMWFKITETKKEIN